MRINNTLLVSALALPSYGFALAAIPSGTWLSTAALSLGAGLAALVLMAGSATLSARWVWIESLFGGLDRVYEAHKWLGVWALVFASVHFAFKAGMEGWDTSVILDLSPFFTRLVRQLSLLALMLIVMLALNRKIPYAQWRWWHKLSGPLFLIVILHWLSFKSPVTLTSPGGIWVASMATLGVVAAFYKLLLYPYMSGHAEYCVEQVDAGPSAIRLVMRPVKRGVPFTAGQFAFLSIHEPGLREPHPFTIASAGGQDQSVEFLIRAVGDYTERLVATARSGMRAEVYAPFGRFRRPTSGKREIWIAGGVGISPFLAWLKDESATNLGRVSLFLFNTPGREFPDIDEVRVLADRRGIELIPLTGIDDGGNFRQRLAAIVGENGKGNVEIQFCGPRGLLQRVRDEMTTLGVPRAQLRFELFEFR